MAITPPGLNGWISTLSSSTFHMTLPETVNRITADSGFQTVPVFGSCVANPDFQSVPSATASGRVPSPRTPRRPVIWNPFHKDHGDLVLHPHYGEGLVLGERDDGMVSIRFSPSSPPIWLLKRAVTFPAEEETYRRILRERLVKYIHLAYYFAPFVIKHSLSRAEQERQYNLHPHYLSHQTAGNAAMEAVGHQLWHLYESLGIDPIAFALHLMVGESPWEIAMPKARMRGDTSQVTTGKWERDDYGNYSANYHLQNKRLLTPDVIREALFLRPWQEEWGPLGQPYPPAVRSAGHYYPSYYPQQADRPHDMTELYFDFREGRTEAVERAAKAMREPVDAWMRHTNRSSNGLIVPMIGQAPLMELASHFGYPVAFPWAQRPLDYGKGVEGKRTSEKMRLVRAALRLEENPSASDLIAGRPVLLLDDNVTDFVTYMWARKLLLDAGATEVGLVTLTHTIRSPREIPWSTR